MICVFCGQPAQGNFSIHRDGFGVGPEVDLCDACGGDETPTCAEIWDQIAMPTQHSFAHRPLPSPPFAHLPALPDDDDLIVTRIHAAETD